MRRVMSEEIGKDQDNYHIHLARYMFAARQFSSSSTVLEIGCGSGYGARLLSDFALEVDAYDIASEELNQKWASYQKSNLGYHNSLPNKKYDFIVSFEVVEHVNESDLKEYFNNIKTRLKKNGVVFLSTPRAIPFKDRSKNRQKEHIYEYSPEEFKELLKNYFNNVFLFSQNDAIISTQNPQMAWNLVAICI
jgi:2-polyprenyl-3-methyl-5-hydroxy-6-metoxy-1,4-benzoquinol methylase